MLGNVLLQLNYIINMLKHNYLVNKAQKGKGYLLFKSGSQKNTAAHT